MAEMGGGELDAGTLILPILERITDPKINRQQIDTQVELNRTLLQLIKTFEGFNSAYKGGGGGKGPTNRNPLQPQAPSTLMNAFSWMGEKKDKAVEFIKKGFFKLFKTDYFGNLLKSVGALAKALGNTFMSWLKFFIMMAFIDPSGGFMRDIINLFTQIGMIVFKTVMPLIPVAVKMMFDTIVYVFKLVLKLMPQIISTIMQTFTQLGNTFPILKPIIGFINQFLSALRSLFVILNDPKADKGGAFQSFLKKVFKILGNVLEKVLDFVVEKAPIVFNYLLDFIENTLIPAFIKYAPKILDAFSQGLDTLINKYPNLKVWIQPFKDILDMISAFIGSSAKFNAQEYIQGLDDYKKKEKELMGQRVFQKSNEESRLKMLDDLQKKYIDDNKIMLEKANVDFNKLNDDKLNLAKDKWSDFISHALDTLGAAYGKLPTEAKVTLWGLALLKVTGWLISIGTWAVQNKTVLLAIGRGLAFLGGKFMLYGRILLTVFGYLVGVFKAIGIAIATFIGGLSATAIAIVVAVLAVIGLVWYFWDDITKFFSDLWKAISDWWDTVKILEPLQKIGKTIVDFFGSLIDDFVGLFKNIKLPDWFGGMGGGTDADELNNSNRNLPYDPQTDPKYKKALLDSAIENQSMVTKLTNSPDNINKMIREDQKAKKSINYYDKITKPFAEELSQSVKDGIKIKAPTIDIGGSIGGSMPKADTNWFDDFSFKLKKMFTSIFEWINDVLPDWFPGKNKTSTFDKIFSIANTKNEQEFQQTESLKKEIESLGGLKTSAIKNYLENSDFFREQAKKSGGENKYLQTYLGENYNKDLYDALMKLRNDAYQNKSTDNITVIKARNAVINSKKLPNTK